MQQCSSRINDSRTDVGISGDHRISESTVTYPVVQNEGHLRSRATVSLFHKFTSLTQGDEENRTR